MNSMFGWQCPIHWIATRSLLIVEKAEGENIWLFSRSNESQFTWDDVKCYSNWLYTNTGQFALSQLNHSAHNQASVDLNTSSPLLFLHNHVFCISLFFLFISFLSANIFHYLNMWSSVTLCPYADDWYSLLFDLVTQLKHNRHSGEEGRIHSTILQRAQLVASLIGIFPKKWLNAATTITKSIKHLPELLLIA